MINCIIEPHLMTLYFVVVLNDQSCDVIPLRQYDWTLNIVREIVRMSQSGVGLQNAIN